MNLTIMNSNLALQKAYNQFQQGSFNQALESYKIALKSSTGQDLKTNIKCTMAIIEQTLGNYEESIELLCDIQSSKHGGNNLVLLRVYANLTMFELMEGNYTKTLQHFESIMEIIQKQKNLETRDGLLKFCTFLFFRVTTVQQIAQQIQNIDIRGMRAEELYCVSLLAFNSQLCGCETQEKIQNLCYEEFKKLNRYDLALFSLRSLIYFTKNPSNKAHYEKQLAKMVMMGHFREAIDFLNYEPYQVIQAIMEQFITFRKHLQPDSHQQSQEVPKNKRSNDQQLIVQWTFAISLVKKELHRTRQLDSHGKHQIQQMLNNMQQEMNPLVIRSLIKNNYFYKYYDRAQKGLYIIPKIFTSKIMKLLKLSFNKISKEVVLTQHNSRNSMTGSDSHKGKEIVKHDRSKSFTRLREDKENTLPLGISIVSSKVSKDSNRKKIFQEQYIHSYHKKMLKMVRLCEYGGFLNKRNFNSEGGQFKFVKITNHFIKWGKDPQRIQDSCQIYPLKDVRSIVYGRVSPNLNQSWNKMLSYSQCFSLLLHKRSLDFYCKSYQELEAWVCGLSQVLKKEGNKIVGYTPGKLRWKKMFAILKENFIEPLKVQEKRYYYENAYALKLFARNGYKLPNKGKQRR